MSDLKGKILDNEFMSLVSGGRLAEGWQDSVKNSVIAFLKMSDEELKMYGVSRNVDSLLATMDNEDFRRQEGVTASEVEKVKEYVRSIYVSLEASIK